MLSIGFSMKTYFCRLETVTFQDSLNYQAGNTETYQSEPLKRLSNTTSPHIQIKKLRGKKTSKQYREKITVYASVQNCPAKLPDNFLE